MATLVLTVATLVIPAFNDPFFYYRDDYQSYFLPMFGEIARLLGDGQFPLISDRLWYGGAITAEYQLAVFNPVSLASYLIISFFNALHVGATVFVLIHMGILAAALYLLARELGVDRPAAMMTAVVGCTSGWLIYWAAATWIVALVGTSWFAWALWGFLKALRDARWMLPAAFLTFMVLVSGWPSSDIALAVAVTTLLGVWLYRERDIRACLRVGITFGAGVLLAGPALLPLAEYLDESTRTAYFATSRWRISLDGLFAGLGNPVALGFWTTWDGSVRPLPAQYFYHLAWFVPLVLFNIFGARRDRLRGTGEIFVFALCLVFLILSQAPSVWFLKDPFRFLPYLHFAVILAVALAITRARAAGELWRPWPVILGISLPFLVAISNAPATWKLQLAMLVLVSVLAFAVMRCQRFGLRSWPALLIASHVLLFCWFAVGMPANTSIPNWRPPLDRPALKQQPDPRVGRTFALYPPLPLLEPLTEAKSKQQADLWKTISPGNTALLYRRESINGYSPIRQAGFARNFCFNHIGASCPEGPARTLSTEPQSGMSFLDLMGVDRVVAAAGSYAREFSRLSGDDWRPVGRSPSAEIYERSQPKHRIGNLVLWPNGSDIEALDTKASEEAYRINGSGAGGRIILARAWYPGFRAYLNGKELSVHPVARLVPSVVLQANTEGELLFEYRPAGLTTGKYAAVLGVLVLIAYFMFGAAIARVAGRRCGGSNP